MSNLTVTASPHIHDGQSTRRIMLDVVIALVPALVAATILFGPRALLLTACTVLAAVAGEYISRRVMKRSTDSIGDLTAVITGLLLALNLPVSMPIWMAMLGGAIATIVVKQLFGGVGQNFVNPAIAARIILLISFPAQMSSAWTEPLGRAAAVDGVSAATPLAIAAAQSAADAVSSATVVAEPPALMDLFLGVHAGSMGETCAVALLLGGLYLVIRKVISPVIPLCFVGTTVLITALGGQDPMYQLLSGGLLLGAIFMATDYTTSPVNLRGRIVFGIGCGFITAVIRLFANLPEGVSYAILIMNILVPHIETITLPKPFGDRGVKS